jgi:hypothetical protein
MIHTARPQVDPGKQSRATYHQTHNRAYNQPVQYRAW